MRRLEQLLLHWGPSGTQRKYAKTPKSCVKSLLLHENCKLLHLHHQTFVKKTPKNQYIGQTPSEMKICHVCCEKASRRATNTWTLFKNVLYITYNIHIILCIYQRSSTGGPQPLGGPQRCLFYSNVWKYTLIWIQHIISKDSLLHVCWKLKHDV